MFVAMLTKYQNVFAADRLKRTTIFSASQKIYGIFYCIRSLVKAIEDFFNRESICKNINFQKSLESNPKQTLLHNLPFFRNLRLFCSLNSTRNPILST